MLLQRCVRIGVLLNLVWLTQTFAADGSDLGWMSGCWEIQRNEPGSGETWSKPVGGTLLGIGYTVRDGRLATFEYMRIERRESGEVYFVAQPRGQAETEFKMTRMDGRSIVFENPEHDFPQTIRYWSDGEDLLNARVEATDGESLRGFDLVMRRTSCQ